MTVTILGCGPAGLLAAHAAHQNGHKLKILSRKQPSAIRGAQFIHEAIRPFNDPYQPDGRIVISKIGSGSEYARKIHGNTNVPTAWSSYENGIIDGWRMKELYQKLWDLYEPNIEHTFIDTPLLDTLEENERYGDLIVSTVPTRLLCRVKEDHFFTSRTVWIEERDDHTIMTNCVLFNDEPGTKWYRASNLWGDTSYEYAEPLPGAKRVEKPYNNNCTCRPNIVRAGRYGKWHRGVLTTDAYHEVQRALLNMQ